ncbi:MAG TPA: permease-like cell division protein FtsX [Candidatus Lustribacter sp.]|nr:permease-like cell division protein FtsX [Candidatus Lustribacter sp.]
MSEPMKPGFLLSETANGMRRNLSMAVSVVLVTMISMYLLGLGMLAQRQADTMKDYWYERVQVSIFLCVDKSLYPNCAGKATTEGQRDQIRAQLEQMRPPVKDVFYESQAEAFARFKAQFKNSPIGEQATERAFADSFRVSLSDPSKFDVIASSFQGAPGVGRVQDQKELLNRFFSFINALSWSAIVLASLMVLCAVLLISTTIRQTAFSRRRETGIMRLVGASNLTIQLPFVLETMISSLLGAGLAVGMLWATVRYGVSGYLSSALLDTAFIGVADVSAIAPYVVGGVALLAIVTSAVTLRRYLGV